MKRKNRYGPGPYKVEFTVLIGESKKFFTIETAPTVLMPHSIHAFLQMVEAGTWDDTALINGDHILVASMKNKMGEVKQQTSDITLMFPEYTSDYPHDIYTVGFAGNPGGPEFYINMQNNDSIHSGRQSHHHSSHDADPCFAKVVRGVDIFNEINGKTVAIIEHAEILK